MPEQLILTVNISWLTLFLLLVIVINVFPVRVSRYFLHINFAAEEHILTDNLLLAFRRTGVYFWLHKDNLHLDAHRDDARSGDYAT